MSDVTLHLGDCLEVMRGMPDKSVDAVITGCFLLACGMTDTSRQGCLKCLLFSLI